MNWYVPENLKSSYLAGFTFNKICKQSICPRYEQKFYPEEIDEETLIFLNLDYFETFLEFLKRNNLNKKFNLLTHNSDRDFTKEMFEQIEIYVNKIYAINATVSNDRVKKIPLGFNDQSTEILDRVEILNIPKTELVYLNFKPHHHPERPKCMAYFETKNWATVEKMPYRELPLSQDDYYKKIQNFKYMICPRGTGIDTHRIYESLLFGIIPIVKSCELDDLYVKFPIVIVKQWEDVTEELLQNTYSDNLIKYSEWKKNNQNWNEPIYWIN